jgi:hypothetical protein
MVGKCGILPFELARLLAGGISDYRLHRFWADRAPNFNPRCDGVGNELTGATIDLFDKAMAQIRRTAGQFFDFYADRCGRATC